MVCDIINSYIQKRLAEENLEKVSAVDAARWLDMADILTDSKSRPGLPLRKMLRQGLIENSHQQANKRWFIYRQK